MSAATPSVVHLPEDMISTDLDAFKQTLIGAVDARAAIVLDGSAVTRAGTAALQLLLALVNLVGEQGGSVELRAPSKPLNDAITTLGLWEHPRFGRLR